jgi:hypothetical protein
MESVALGIDPAGGDDPGRRPAGMGKKRAALMDGKTRRGVVSLGWRDVAGALEKPRKGRTPGPSAGRARLTLAVGTSAWTVELDAAVFGETSPPCGVNARRAARTSCAARLFRDRAVAASVAWENRSAGPANLWPTRPRPAVGGVESVPRESPGVRDLDRSTEKPRPPTASPWPLSVPVVQALCPHGGARAHGPYPSSCRKQISFRLCRTRADVGTAAVG